MSRRGNLLAVMVLAATVGVAGAPASAGFVTQTVMVSPTMRPTDFTQSLIVHPFDSTLGSLESVVISFSDKASITGTLTNNSATNRNFTINENLNYGLSFGQTSLLSDAYSVSQNYSSVSHLTGSNTVNFGEYDPSKSVSATPLVTGPLLDAVLGTSDITFMFKTLTQTTIVGLGGNVAYDIQTKANATVTVTYNYITNNVATPEPASLLMTAMGGLAVVSAGYLKKRSNSRRGVDG